MVRCNRAAHAYPCTMPLRSVLAVLSACVLVAVLPVGALADDEPPDYEQVVDLTFPTAEVSGRSPIRQVDGTSYGFIDDYAHARGNSCGVHRATDIFGEAGQPVFAATGGTITFMPDPAPSYGWMIRVRADDGRTYNYIHLGHDDGPGEGAYAPGLDAGDRVERGQHIGYLGSSGNASEELPHLHFEIHDETVADSNEWGCEYINPYNSLLDAVDRADFSTAPVEPPPTSAVEGTPAEVDRVAGPDRVGTALRLAAAAYDGAEQIVLAPAESFPEAAAAGPLAAALDAPVLTTWQRELDDRVAQAIRDLGASEVVLVGGLEVLSDRVVAGLVAKAGIEPDGISRLSGSDAFGTAAAVAEAVWDELGSREQVVVALGDHPEPSRAWPDALTSGWYGAVTGAPVLLTDHDRLPQTTAAALDGIDEAVIVGGAVAVSDAIADEIAELVGTLRRLAGPDRFGTAAAVADDLLDRGAGVSPERVWAATGHGWADALAAAQTIAASGEVFLLVDGNARGGDGSIEAWFDAHRENIGAGRVIGGAGAVNDAAMELLRERIASS
jgi:murein DD-endopeptidase MepM/ murein hydrolase activator NlpD